MRACQAPIRACFVCIHALVTYSAAEALNKNKNAPLCTYLDRCGSLWNSNKTLQQLQSKTGNITILISRTQPCMGMTASFHLHSWEIELGLRFPQLARQEKAEQEHAAEAERLKAQPLKDTEKKLNEAAEHFKGHWCCHCIF